jgi:hypothetical protein
MVRKWLAASVPENQFKRPDAAWMAMDGQVPLGRKRKGHGSNRRQTSDPETKRDP